MARKKVICFDLDGTIIDSKEAQVIAFTKIIKKYKLPKIQRERIINHFGKPADKVISGLFPELPKSKVKNMAIEFYKILDKETKLHTKVIPKAISTLKKLKKSYDLAVISNNPKSEIITFLKEMKIPLNLFDYIVGDDQITKPKPAPDAILKVQELSNSEIEYMVGDTRYDIIAGHAAHVKTIAVLTGIGSFRELYKESPTAILESIELIPKFLSS